MDVETNNVLYNPGAYTNGYSICVYPLCILENGGVLECYTTFKDLITRSLLAIIAKRGLIIR